MRSRLRFSIVGINRLLALAETAQARRLVWVTDQGSYLAVEGVDNGFRLYALGTDPRVNRHWQEVVVEACGPEAFVEYIMVADIVESLEDMPTARHLHMEVTPESIQFIVSVRRPPSGHR